MAYMTYESMMVMLTFGLLIVGIIKLFVAIVKVLVKNMKR